MLRIIRKEHYLLNQSRDIRLISQPKNGISYTLNLYKKRLTDITNIHAKYLIITNTPAIISRLFSKGLVIV
jgi:hypothetical protein